MGQPADAVRFSGRIVFCADAEASARFYQGILGFQREWADGSDINLRATVAESGTATVSIFLHHGDNPTPVDVGMFDVDNVDAFSGAGPGGRIRRGARTQRHLVWCPRSECHRPRWPQRLPH